MGWKQGQSYLQVRYGDGAGTRKVAGCCCCPLAVHMPVPAQVRAAVPAVLLRAQHPLRGDHAAAAGWRHPAPPRRLHPHRLGEGGSAAPCAWASAGRGAGWYRGPPRAGVGSDMHLELHVRWGWGWEWRWDGIGWDGMG